MGQFLVRRARARGPVDCRDRAESLLEGKQHAALGEVESHDAEAKQVRPPSGIAAIAVAMMCMNSIAPVAIADPWGHVADLQVISATVDVATGHATVTYEFRCLQPITLVRIRVSLDPAARRQRRVRLVMGDVRGARLPARHHGDTAGPVRRPRGQVLPGVTRTCRQISTRTSVPTQPTPTALLGRCCCVPCTGSTDSPGQADWMAAPIASDDLRGPAKR